MPSEPQQQVHFCRIGEALHRIGRRVEQPRVAGAIERSRRRLTLPADRAYRVRSLFQRRQRDVVGICECLLVAGHRANAHAAIDVERAGLDDAFFQAPALEAGVLEIEVGEVDVVRVNGTENLRRAFEIEAAGCEQQALGIGKQRRSDGGEDGFSHRDPFQCGVATGTAGETRDAAVGGYS